MYILTILMSNPNFLILDEPTNDLDLLTLTVLEEFLQEFEGVIIVVSHDRYFMNKLVDHLFVFEGEGIVKDLNGNYGDYRAYIADKEQQQKQNRGRVEAPKVSEEPVKEKKKLSYMEQREYDGLEGEIEKLESRKAEIHDLFAGGTLEGAELEQLSIELGDLQKQIAEKTDRWLTLAELA